MFSGAGPSDEAAAVDNAAPEDETAGLLQDLGKGDATGNTPEDDRSADILDALRYAAEEQTREIEHVCRCSLAYLLFCNNDRAAGLQDALCYAAKDSFRLQELSISAGAPSLNVMFNDDVRTTRGHIQRRVA